VQSFEQNKYIYVFDINTLELTPYTLKLRKSNTKIYLFCSKFGIDANLLGYVIDETDMCKLGSLKSKFNGIFILKWLFVSLNVENSFELLDTLRFEIILPSIL
jgi:hypothetical protein